MIGVPQFAAAEPKYMQIIHIVILLFVNSLCLKGTQTQINLKGKWKPDDIARIGSSCHLAKVHRGLTKLAFQMLLI